MNQIQLRWQWLLEQQQELRRKDKVLAEAAALLIASKKIQAYWGEDGED